MDDRRLGMAVRARRHQRGWRLADLAVVAGVGATACSVLERGGAGRLSVRIARAIAGAVDLPLGWDIGWQRSEVDRLLDADHAALAARLTRRLEALGWTVRAEVSFNQYGDRGRIDLLAFHPSERILLVIEVKTAIVDAQTMLGSLDMKARVASAVARELGWKARLVVPALVVLDGSTARRHLRAIDPLLGRYNLRGRAALDWLREPFAGRPTGLVFLTKLPDNAERDVRKAGRRRVRVRGTKSRSHLARSGAKTSPPVG
jgi:transcriptional regulator with XRE-family HTH domain